MRNVIQEQQKKLQKKKKQNKHNTTQKHKQTRQTFNCFPQNRFRRDTATQDNCTESTPITATDALTRQDNEQGLYLGDIIYGIRIFLFIDWLKCTEKPK